MNDHLLSIRNIASEVIKDDNENHITNLTDTSAACKRSQRISAAWQEKCKQKDSSLMISSEKKNTMYFGVWADAQGSIYELRVSVKNPCNHFFKTICKVIAYNGIAPQNRKFNKISTVNYIVLPAVLDTLQRGFPKKLTEALIKTHGITVNILSVTI